jgi:hypothetical protein
MLVRIKRTGQVVDMVPAVGQAMIAGGTAEPVTKTTAAGETAALRSGDRDQTRGKKPAARRG